MRSLLVGLFLCAFLSNAHATSMSFGPEGSPDCELFLTAEGNSGLELEFRLNRIERIAGPTGERLLIDGLEREGVPDEDWLPGGSRLLAVPARAGLTLTVEAVETMLLEDFHPAPRPAWISEQDGREVRLADRSAPEASDWAGLSTPAIWLGQRIVALDLNPVLPGERDGEWRVATHLRLHVGFDGGVPVNPGREGRRLSPLARELVGQAVLNPATLPVASERDDAEEPVGRYLVVGPAAALPFLDNWLEFRREQGWEIELRSAEELGVGEENWQPIRAAAQELYDGDGLDCLLLIGDMNRSGSGYNLPGDMVPGGPYAENTWSRRIVSDHSVALLDGDDYFSDVLVGRFTADNATQLSTMVNRGLMHEREPLLDDADWLRRALVVYDVSGAGTRRETSLQIREHLLEAGFAQVDTINNNRDSNPQSPTLVSNRINAGTAFVNYRGFGYRDAWNGPSFSSAHILGLSNVGEWPFFTSMVCGGGDFASTNYEPCLGEAALQAGSVFEPTGGIAFVGPSEEDTHTQWNNCIDQGLYHGLLMEGLRSPAALLERGKLELWLNFPNSRAEDWQPAGSHSQATNVPFYHWCYNLLGDPGIELRMGHQRNLSAALPDELPLGLSHLELLAVDESGEALEGVIGCLSGSDNERLALARSDASGRLVFGFAPLAQDSVTLLLHGRDLVPQRRTWLPVAREALLTLRDWSIEDEAGQIARIVPGGTGWLNVILEERGTLGSAEASTLRIVSLDDRLSIVDGALELVATSPGDTLEARFGLLASPLLLDGDRLPAILGLLDPIGDTVWTRPLEFVVAGARLGLQDVVLTSGSLEPGGTASVALQVRNDGALPIDAASLRLYSTSEAATIEEGEIGGQSLAPEESAAIGPVGFSIDGGVVPGALLPFELVAFAADGATVCRLPLQIQAGERGPEDPLGPDAHGYVIHHSAQQHPGAPAFLWESVAGSGVEIDLEDQGEAYNEEGLDGASRVVALPFPFRFYGQDYDTITVCSNGWLAMGAQPYAYTGLNTTIPAAQGPRAMVAAFWTDLYNQFNSTRFAHVYRQYDEDGHRFVVQWDNVMHTGHPWNSNWFQVILLDPAWHPTPTGDGEILIVYDDLVTDLGDNFFTVGIEAPDLSHGLCYAFNGETTDGMPAIASQTALRITTVGTYGETPVVDPLRPGAFRILGAAPNPFNPSTRVRLLLPEPGRLDWKLFDLTGRLAASGAPRRSGAGEATLFVDGSGLASGLYLLRADWRPELGPPSSATTKLLLVK